MAGGFGPVPNRCKGKSSGTTYAHAVLEITTPIYFIT